MAYALDTVRVIVLPFEIHAQEELGYLQSEISEAILIPGIATGLAVTATGGDILQDHYPLFHAGYHFGLYRGFHAHPG